jgi:hypothetical protein
VEADNKATAWMSGLMPEEMFQGMETVDGWKMKAETFVEVSPVVCSSKSMSNRLRIFSPLKTRVEGPVCDFDRPKTRPS